MDRDQLARHLMQLFLGELEDHERTLERDLLSLERETDAGARRELVESLFRAAHSLKGAARAVGARSIESTCHRLEQSLSELRGQDAAVERGRVEELLGHLDAVKASAERLRIDAASAGQPEPAPAASAARERPPPRPAAAIAPIDPPPRPSVAGEPSPAPPLTPPGPGAQIDGRATRVATQKLDQLVARTSELAIAASRATSRLGDLAALREQLAGLARKLPDTAHDPDGLHGRLRALERTLELTDDGLREDARALGGAVRQLDDAVRRLRMVPLREAYEGLDRSVRDLSRSLDKQAALVTQGEQVEMDRELVQALREPLLHLVRNAVAHGIESVPERRAREKPETGRIALSARHLGAVVELCVEDDGRGLDIPAIRARARELGLAEVDDDELAAYVFAPGFSTARGVTEIAGRGVGLDAVKRSVERLHGRVTVRSQAGHGTTFVLELPLTLSKLRCLFLRLGRHPYAVPTSHGVRVVRFRRDQLLEVSGGSMVRASDELVPLRSLAALLGLPATEPEAREVGEALVVSSVGRSAALLVSALLDEREAIVQKLPRRLAGAPYLSGATTLPDGRVAPVLNGGELARAAAGSLAPGGPLFAEVARVHKRVLVTDDSITTRALIKSIVEQGGYEVTAARDGVEAFRLLTEQPFDLLVSDVQMPNMDGFALTEKVRATPALARLPVVLVTSLEGERDRLRGLEAGADAYLGKSAFDQRVLLDTIGGLL